jgi:hypothetical protein
MSRTTSHIVFKAKRGADHSQIQHAEVREFEDNYLAHNKVKAFDSDKMYARNEARRQSCSEAFKSRNI